VMYCFVLDLGGSRGVDLCSHLIVNPITKLVTPLGNELFL
jgi:hypothetical protein